jgi:DNA processing protein
LTEKAYWLAWSQIEGVGPITMRRLQQQFGSLSVGVGGKSSDLRSVHGIGTANMNAISTARKFIKPEELLRQHQRQKPSILDTQRLLNILQLLLEIPDPPALLYWAGNLTSWDQNRAIAIVGTRHPYAYGRRWARMIGRALARKWLYGCIWFGGRDRCGSTSGLFRSKRTNDRGGGNRGRSGISGY